MQNNLLKLFTDASYSLINGLDEVYALSTEDRSVGINLFQLIHNKIETHICNLLQIFRLQNNLLIDLTPREKISCDQG